MLTFFPPIIVGQGVPGPLVAPPGGEFWSRVVKRTDTARTNPARSADPDLVLALSAGVTYMIRMFVLATANQGGPSMSSRLTGPAVTSLYLQRQIGGGSQDAAALTPAFVARVNSFDTADAVTPMNTGAPATALAVVEYRGTITPSAGGTLAFEWTGSSALAANAITVRAGSYIEYRAL